MLSEASKRNLGELFQRAVKGTLLRNAGDNWTIAPAGSHYHRAHPGKRLLLITLSSFEFRMTTIFHIPVSKPLQDYFSGDLPAEKCDDAIAERVNLYSGALCREMTASSPYLAMSTPYALHGQCLAWLDELRADFLSTYEITINDAVQLQATLCLRCFAPLTVELGSVDAIDAAGELEMF